MASRNKRASSQDGDDFLGEDIGYPNIRAQRRGFKAVIWFLIAAGFVAVVMGLTESADHIAAAFPNSQALLDADAWGRFFTGLGMLTKVAAVTVLVLLFWRWLAKRR